MSFDKNTQPKEDGFRFTPEQAFQLFKERIATQEEKEKQNKKLKWSIVCSSVALGIILSVALIICLFISPRLVNCAKRCLDGSSYGLNKSHCAPRWQYCAPQ